MSARIAFIDLDGDGGHDIVYTTGDYRFLVRREIGAPVSTLYATVGRYGFTLRSSDDRPLTAIRPAHLQRRRPRLDRPRWIRAPRARRRPARHCLVHRPTA